MEFPDVFRVTGKDEKAENEQCGWSGGFDCVLGNPPWERVKLQEKEWFADKCPDIANAGNAKSRKQMIDKIKSDDQEMYQCFLSALRESMGESRFVRDTGLFPLCGRGDVNTYAIFSELNRLLINGFGRIGCILPSGIATDDTTKYYFQNLIETQSIVSLFDFENRNGIFQGVHRSFKFCLLTLSGLMKPNADFADFVFFAHEVSNLNDKTKVFQLSAQDFKLLNPKSLTCPIFRGRIDSELTKHVYSRSTYFDSSVSKFVFEPKIDMTDEVGNFFESFGIIPDGKNSPIEMESDKNAFIRLYESKLFWHYDHRFGTFENCSGDECKKGNARTSSSQEQVSENFAILPRYYVPKDLVANRYRDFTKRKYLLAVRRLTNATNERTAIFCLLPQCGCGNSAFVITLNNLEEYIWYLSCASSFTFDYCSRNKLGGTNFLQFLIEQLPIVPFHRITSSKYLHERNPFTEWLVPRVGELVYVANDMAEFGTELGFFRPFHWSENRRSFIRCELDAAYFHLYLGTEVEWKSTGSKELLEAFPTPRQAVDYIMESFPIVKRKDIAKFGTYRTKETILEIYDEMTEAIRTGKSYQTKLDPPQEIFAARMDTSIAVTNQFIPKMTRLSHGQVENILSFQLFRILLKNILAKFFLFICVQLFYLLIQNRVRL